MNGLRGTAASGAPKFATSSVDGDTGLEILGFIRYCYVSIGDGVVKGFRN